MNQYGQGVKEMSFELSFTYIDMPRLFYHLYNGDETLYCLFYNCTFYLFIYLFTFFLSDFILLYFTLQRIS